MTDERPLSKQIAACIEVRGGQVRACHVDARNILRRWEDSAAALEVETARLRAALEWLARQMRWGALCPRFIDEPQCIWPDKCPLEYGEAPTPCWIAAALKAAEEATQSE
jgi:hypothetical protein